MAAVLIIEDDDRIRASLGSALEDEGHAVRAVPTAEEGIAEQRRDPADMILVDLMLPGIDAFECIRILRRDDDVPIVVSVRAMIRMTWWQHLKPAQTTMSSNQW